MDMHNFCFTNNFKYISVRWKINEYVDLWYNITKEYFDKKRNAHVCILHYNF